MLCIISNMMAVRCLDGLVVWFLPECKRLKFDSLGVFVSVNFACFVPSRSECFHCNATRKAIKTCMNLHTIRQIEHTPCWGIWHFFITISPHCYIWWSMWSLSLKCMRTCFLHGGADVTAIRCLYGLVVWCSPGIPCWFTEFIGITNPH